MNIGCHLSVSKGFLHMGNEAHKIGANTFQFFTRNPRGSKAKDLDKDDVKAYKAFAREHEFGTILAHAPYTLNPCSKEGRTREFAHEIMEDDLRRMEHLPGNYYNFHPGSHVGQGVERGIELISDLLNTLLTKDQSTIVLLETMAGKGSEVGRTFDELYKIMDCIRHHEKVGVCLDTCHVYDAGYDIVHDLDGVLDEFDRIIGIEKLLAVHLNDSKNPYDSHKDRHEKIGEGSLGIETFKKVLNHPKLRHLPFFLETPNDIKGYAKEIRMLKQMYHCPAQK